MNRTEKETTVAELKAELDNVASLVIADFRGLTVEEMNGIRREIRKNKCFYRVIKNTMVKRAIAGTPMEGISSMLTGPTAIAYTFDDPANPAKVLDKFAGEIEKFRVKGGYTSGQVLDVEGVKRLSKMKGKNELRAELLMLLQTPPQDFLRLLNAAPTNFLYLLDARKNNLG